MEALKTTEFKKKALSFSLGAALSTLFFLYRRKSKAESDLVPFIAEQVGGDDEVQNGQIKFSFPRISLTDAIHRSETFQRFMNSRRSVRFFDSKPIPLRIVENCIAAAGTAPSGAHCQPWFFVVVKSPEKKKEIREAVEEEERKNYEVRMGQTWVDEVTHLVSDLHADGVPTKPYLTEAPYIVILMKQKYGLDEYNEKVNHRYAVESVGIAAGMFITALHNSNLATLTSTPMGADAKIRRICGRPAHEKVFLLLPVGYPSKTCTVPYRKPIPPVGTWDPNCLRKNIRDIMSVV